jgi:cell division protein FtsW
MRPTQRRKSILNTQLSSTGTGLLRRHRPDYNLLIIAVILLAVGLITIYAISPGLTQSGNVSSSYYVVKQLIAISLGVVGFAIAAYLPIEFWQKYIKQLIGLSLIAALAVRVLGQRVNGAFRWIQIGGISFQAVELIKFTLLIWLAYFLAQQIKNGKLKDFNSTLKPIVIALFAIGIVVAGLQSDLGSTGVMVVMMAVMCFIAGLPFKRIAIIGGIIIIGLILAVSSSTYRRDRLFTFLHPTQNCQTTGTGYQACQAVIAVGSGGLFGKGLARSVQDYGYLPESDNDSIFAVYAEQFGFVGVTILLCLFLALFKRIKDIMEKAPDNYTRLIVAGVLAWLATQALINIGAMVGLLPLKGITLPLISYGGTSIVFVMVIIGLIFNISHYTKARITEDEESQRGSKYEDIAMRRRNGRPYYARPSYRP